jgi:hypothetical protein
MAFITFHSPNIECHYSLNSLYYLFFLYLQMPFLLSQYGWRDRLVIEGKAKGYLTGMFMHQSTCRSDTSQLHTRQFT